MFKRIAIAATAAALAFSPALAQTAQPAAPKPATQAPAVAPKPATPAPAPAAAAQAKKVNLNTATAADLDALPQIGPARAKAIMDARAKGKFKDWADFMARKVVPSNAEEAIKDKVSF